MKNQKRILKVREMLSVVFCERKGERRSRRRAQPVADAEWSEAKRSSGTFATANGGFAALRMGSLRVGAGVCGLGFRAGGFVKRRGAPHRLKSRVW